MSTTPQDKDWGHMQLRLRKEELLKEINAYLADQHPKEKHAVLGMILGVSHSTVTRILHNDAAGVSLDMLYRVSCQLELGTNIYTPQYGTYMG